MIANIIESTHISKNEKVSCIYLPSSNVLSSMKRFVITFAFSPKISRHTQINGDSVESVKAQFSKKYKWPIVSVREMGKTETISNIRK